MCLETPQIAAIYAGLVEVVSPNVITFFTRFELKLVIRGTGLVDRAVSCPAPSYFVWRRRIVVAVR